MNQEVKAKWLAALRSGEYKQSRGLLRNFVDRYCCLGVLCDLHAKATGGHWKFGRYHESLTSLPYDVAKWAELPLPTEGWVTCDVNVGAVGQTRSLMAMNDTGSTFTEIADKIEAYL
jgi:hypothetical protein